MYLHKDDRELLLDIINTVSNISGVRTDIIEKDYYVTLILKELSGMNLPVVFKGGTSLMSFSFPTEIKPIDNYIYSIIGSEQKDIIAEYELEPFDMRVQSLSRTVVDKTFALCDYYLLGRPERNARHLYDLYKLKDYVSFNDEMKELVKEVREHRLSLGKAIAPAADMAVNIAELADALIAEEFYHKDYDIEHMLSLDDAIDDLEIICRNNGGCLR